MLKIENVTKSFDERVVLDGLDLEVSDGSIFGLVGVNGAGKTTLLRTIAGVYMPEQGHVLYMDRDTYADVDIRKEIFFANDDPYYPIASNISTLKDFYSSFYDLDEEVYQKLLKAFGLPEDRQVSTFSKGMKRQTLLLFALASKPKLLLLDEAFDGLDPIVRYNLKQILYEFIEDNASTIIISSHNLKELEDICDSYGILDKGKIATYGDLLESKNNINKYQLAFSKDVAEDAFDGFDVLHKSRQGSVYTLVIKGDVDDVSRRLSKMKPLILDTLPVNFEELFIYEQGGADDVQ